MSKRFFIYSLICFLLYSCGGKKTTVETKTEPEEEEFINQNENLALAGAINFDDDESLTIYSAILKNVVGDKPGAYIGNQMDKLAVRLENEIEFSEMLRAGEGLILEFNNTSDLYFESGKTGINDVSKQTLDKIIASLDKFPKTSIIIETHTDDSGNEDVNMKMTVERVNSIATYMFENGISQSRIVTKAFGESQPRFKNDTAENRKKNRRVEFGFYASESLKEEAKNLTD